MKTRIFTFIVAAIMISVNSCRKDTPRLDNESLNIADDDAVTEIVFEDVFSTADNASMIAESIDKEVESKSGTEVMTDSCPAIAVSRPGPDLWPKTVTVDFGTGCEGVNNNVRKGKIIIELTAPRMQEGAKRTVTFVDYYFNDIKVEGIKVLETIGFNDNQHFEVSVRLTGGKLTLPDGRTIERSTDHKREWISGLLTRNIWDDECLVSGTATGTDIEGVEYTSTILTALHWTRACRFITGGIVKIERGESLPVMVDFGTGDCDAKAVVTRGDESKEITLRNRHRLWNN
jgi:hypothetical protein